MNFWIPLIKDIILSVAAIITVGLAIYGVRSWRRELTGKTKFDAARRQLQATFKVREAFWSARSRFIAAVEFPPNYTGTRGNHSAQEEYDAFIHVYNNRWKPLWEAIQEFDVAALAVRGSLGRICKAKNRQY